jgi:hypothetical protein
MDTTQQRKGSEDPGRTSSGGLAILDLITQYFGNGGFFNPEMMDHDKVRDMVLECQSVIKRQQFKTAVARALGDLYKRKLTEARTELLATNVELARVRTELLAIKGEAQEDTKLLDWLERPQQITHYVNPFRDVVHRINSGQPLRAAIRAAMMEAGK